MEYSHTCEIAGIITCACDAALPGGKPDSHRVYHIGGNIFGGIEALQADIVTLPVFEDKGLTRACISREQVVREIVKLLFLQHCQGRICSKILDLIGGSKAVGGNHERSERQVEDSSVWSGLRKLHQRVWIFSGPERGIALVRIAGAKLWLQVDKDRIRTGAADPGRTFQ